jgi:serine/threonine-protein kinase RsbW
VTEDTAATTAVPAGRETADYVHVRMPAESAYLSVLRTATAGLAARLDFTLDEIEDLRIAIDEACAMLLAQAIPGTDLECGFDDHGVGDRGPAQDARQGHVRVDGAVRPRRNRGLPARAR